MQIMRVSFTNSAETEVKLKRHRSIPKLAERPEKWLPFIITSVPPSTGPALGISEKMTAADWYSYGRSVNA